MNASLRCIALAGCLLCPAALAQEPDTTASGNVPFPADSLALPPADSLALSPADSLDQAPLQLMGFGDAPLAAGAFGWALSDSLPALRPDIRLTELIADAPGSFTYLFDRPGWPDGWSPFGLSPNARPLSLGAIPFTDIFTGRPAWDLIPLALVAPPRFDPVEAGVRTQLRSFEGAPPRTEATYWRDGEGLQSIDVVHAQRRRRSLRGRPGVLHALGSYGGRATSIPYPGSNLTRGRRSLLRVRYAQRAWSAEILYMSQRRRVGAHGGVVIRSGDPNAIYQSDIAEVVQPEAERRIVRNDLAGVVRAQWFAAGATSVALYRSTEKFRYHNALDTLGVRSIRAGAHIRQPLLRTARSRLALRVAAWSEHVSPRASFRESAQRRFALDAQVSDSLRLGRAGAGATAPRWILAPEASWFFHRSGGPAGAVRLARTGLRTALRVSVSTVRPRVATLYHTGFATLRARRDAEPGRTVTVHMEGAIQAAPFVLGIGALGHRAARPVDLFVEGDGVVAATAGSPLRQVALYADLGWRRSARRGFYALARPTFMYVAAAGDAPLDARRADTLPRWFARARFGVRYMLFEGDLRFDLYAEGMAWSSFRSRSLHAPSGLLAVPEASSLLLGPSNTANIVAEARVRTARLFFAYDHLPAGASLIPGTMLAPVYPLPAGRFRFGVHWPILG